MKKTKKAAALILSAAMALSAFSAMSVGASAEWVKSKSGYSYKDDTTGEKLTGWQTIGGGKYFFDKNGTALTGWRIINGDTYYFYGSEKGKMLTGWAKIGGRQYYFGSDGVMRKGWIKIQGSTYYFGSDGVMLTGTYKINGKIYSFADDGKMHYTSAALGCNVLTVTKGVSFGKSTPEEVGEALPFEDTEYDETSVLFAPTDNSLGIYMFGDNGCASAFMIIYKDISNIAEVRPFFTEAGWKLSDTNKIDDAMTEMYVSPDSSLFGFVTTDDNMALVAGGSYNDIDKLYYDLFAELKNNR